MERHLNRFCFAYLGLLSAVFFYATGLESARRLLWYDEIFTLYVARLPDTKSVIQALLNGADVHPPADYLIRHMSIRLFGESELALRLPSMVALWIASLYLYAFVSKRGGAIPGIVAFCSLMISTAMGWNYAGEGRGYAIWIASMCMTLWAWQRVTDNPKSVVALVLLTASLALGPYSHFYAVLNYAPIIVGEGLRSFVNRRLSAPILFSILVSIVLLIPLYPFAQNAREYILDYYSAPSIRSAYSYYYAPQIWHAAATASGLISCVLISSLKAPREASRSQETIPVHEIGAAVTLCLSPFTAYGIAVLFTGALTLKYTLVTAVGFALLMAYLTSTVGRARRAYATAILLSSFFTLLLSFAWNIRDTSWLGKPSVPSSLEQFISRAEYPVVFSDEGYFLQTHHYLPHNLRERVHFLTDRSSAKAYMNIDPPAVTTEIVLAHLNQVSPINVVDFEAFARQNRRFFVLHHGMGWLMKKLSDDHVDLALHSVFGGYQVFLVTLAP